MGPIEQANEAREPADVDAGPADCGSVEQIPLFDTGSPPTMKTEQTGSAVSEENTEQEHAVLGEAAMKDENPETVSDAPAAAAELAELRLAECIEATESLGMRLRAAREARGMRCIEAAQRLKLPLTTIQALEEDRYERIGEGIYLRGYLSKYLRLLDLPQVLAERVLTEHTQLPPLITSGTVSRPRYLFQRYSVSALYLILTGVIIVPAVLLATRGGLEPTLTQITPLDSPEPATPAPAASGSVAVDNGAATAAISAQPSTAAKASDETPLVASLTPFPAAKQDASEGSDAGRAAVPPSPGAHSLRLSLTEPSWVEIVAGDGEKLDYGLLPAGTVRSYSSDKSIDIRLGNTSGATIEVDGKAQDLTPFRHANVAHFKLSSGEMAISHSGT